MWLAIGLATSLPILAGLFVLDAVFEPFFRTASTAMVADLVPSERRPRAYALLRMIQNLGVVFGPMVGGFIATQSYLLAFLLASAANAIYFLIALFFIKETKPQREGKPGEKQELGYGRLLRDYPFLAFAASFTLVTMSYAQMMIFLPVYIKEEFAIPENFYGLIMATNAAMVVLLQYSITRAMERFRRPLALAWGGLFIGAGVGSVVLGNSFPHFLLSMIILTIGEMIVIPTSQAYVADSAPVDMRGRYMGVFTLTWSIGFGLGPVLGGALSDNFAPVAIWYGGLIYGLVSVLAFLVMAAKVRPAVVTASPLDTEAI